MGAPALKGLERSAMQPMTVYKLSKAICSDGVERTIGLKELSSEDEILASKIGNFGYMKAQYEAVKLSIGMVNDKPLTNAEGEIDILWDKIGAKARSLLLKAYTKLTSASEEEDKAFFDSANIRV